MCSVAKTLAQQMTYVLQDVATAHAKGSGYSRRESKCTAAVFCTTVVMGWLQHPDAGGGTLARFAALQGVHISPQGLLDRFTPGAADLLLRVLRALLAQSLPAAPACPLPLLERYVHVILEDSSTVSLPDVLDTIWRGCGGNRSGRAGLKLQAHFDLRTGDLQALWLTSGRTQDRASPGRTRQYPTDSLRIADLGYFILDRLQSEQEAGCRWITRLHPQAGVILADETVCKGEELAAVLARGGGAPQELAIQVGLVHRLPCRLLALPRAEETTARVVAQLHKVARRKQQPASPASLARAPWDLFITNDPTLTIDQVRTLYGARWQIEILWRTWKSGGKLSRWRSSKPWRILCEVYAKLIGLVLLQRILARGVWQVPSHSLVHAGQMVRDHAVQFVHDLRHPYRLTRTLAALLAALPLSPPVASHATRPTTFKRLAQG